ncbi:MAG TPA: sulfur transferase domain-containing protein [Pyrinomonadaceae bacterium]|nr:sulfur transferase domain-containing protein [Pyrinomonadaceae bacterium]
MPSHADWMRGRAVSTAAAVLWLLLLCPAAPAQDDSGANEPRTRTLTNFHQVNERLYRGGQPREGGFRELAARGVNTVINLRDDDERAAAEGSEARAAGLRYFNIPFGRLGRPTDEQVEHALALINAPENGVVFVHCAKGQDRTGTIIAVYRLTHDRWTAKQATTEAEHYGMKFWQHWMKDYIHDYYERHAHTQVQ